jgi:hypothetical protein
MKTYEIEKMIVYLSGQQIVVETNIAWALPYWTKRKQINDSITWRMK